MAVEIAGTWDFGWSAPKTEFDQWWAVMRSYEIPMLHMCPRSGMKHQMLMEHESFDELLMRTWTTVELTPVFVDEDADVELEDFIHPENALYIFGKANYSPAKTHGKDHLGVRIDCPTMGMLWPHQALAQVMRERGRP